MELENIERLKELIKERDSLLFDLNKIQDVKGSIKPDELRFVWASGYDINISIPHGTIFKIVEFLESLYNGELEEINNLIKKYNYDFSKRNRQPWTRRRGKARRR